MESAVCPDFPRRFGCVLRRGIHGRYELRRLGCIMAPSRSGSDLLQPPRPDPQDGDCTGTYGTAVVQDYGSLGYAVSYNHGLFAQTRGRSAMASRSMQASAWRRNTCPARSANLTEALPAHPIDFGWGDKVAPRVGVAWDVFKDGKMKVFGSYGVFVDNMKLNLAISSFGGADAGTIAPTR